MEIRSITGSNGPPQDLVDSRLHKPDFAATLRSYEKGRAKARPLHGNFRA
jgi:hypothetical protein